LNKIASYFPETVLSIKTFPINSKTDPDKTLASKNHRYLILKLDSPEKIVKN